MLRLIRTIGNQAHQFERADLIFILDKLTQNMAKYDERASHRIAYAITAAILFLLIDQSIVKSFSFLGVSVEHLNSLKAFIPPLAIYFALSCLINQAGRRQSEEIAESIIKRQFENLWLEDLEEFLTPHPVIRTMNIVANEVQGIKRWLSLASAYALAVPMVLSVVIFYVYSSVVLYIDLGHGVVFWISFVASTVFALQFLVLMWIFSDISDEADKSQKSYSEEPEGT